MSSPQLPVFVDKYFGLEYFLRSGSLTRSEFGIAEYLSANSSKIKNIVRRQYTQKET